MSRSFLRRKRKNDTITARQAASEREFVICTGTLEVVDASTLSNESEEELAIRERL